MSSHGPKRRHQLKSTGAQPAPSLQQPEVDPPLMAALNAIPQGVAIFNERLCCVAANVALDSVNLASAKGGVAQTVQGIFGDEASQLEPAIRHVWTAGESLAGLALDLFATQVPITAHWRANLYPVTDAGGRVRFVAMILCDVSAQDNLQQRLRRIAHQAQFFRSLVRTPDNKMTDLFECSAELLQQSMDLRDRSRTAAAFRRVSWALLRSGLIVPSAPANDTGYRLVPELNEACEMQAIDARKPSRREVQVMELLAEGKVNKEIAATLSLSTRTMEAYRANLMAKLNVHSVAELVRYAVRNKIIPA